MAMRIVSIRYEKNAPRILRGGRSEPGFIGFRDFQEWEASGFGNPSQTRGNRNGFNRYRGSDRKS